MPQARQGASDELKTGPLRSSSNGLGREQVSDIQRARILAAMAEEVAARGAGKVTVAHVVARSGVSRRTFYELFDDREECFLAAFDEAVQRLAAVVVPVYEQPGSWRVRMRAALTAGLEFLDNEPCTARMLIVEALGAGPKALERRQHVLLQIIKIVDQGRAEAKQDEGPSSLTAEAAVGAVLSIVHTRMVDEGSPSQVDLVNELTSMIVLPYLGPAAARREIEHPTLKRARKAAGRSPNPLKDLEMRLTYRTVRVLIAIGDHPGVSNRRVADAAGVSDQGQISKLLTRLDHLGLIENSGFGRAKGESNSWYLTDRGRQIEHAIREQTEHR
jgi:AcrR family transcriptional regulator